MFRSIAPRRILFLTAAAALGFVAPAVPQPAGSPRPTMKLEAVAETRLLMEGLAQANFRGLERQLAKKPADADTWAFARGQALLIGEVGNLLLIRPPRNQGQEAWMASATELRTAAVRLARAAAEADYERCRTGMTDVANACNRCHQTFRVPVKVVPFADPAERKVGL